MFSALAFMCIVISTLTKFVFFPLECSTLHIHIYKISITTGTLLNKMWEIIYFFQTYRLGLPHVHTEKKSLSIPKNSFGCNQSVFWESVLVYTVLQTVCRNCLQECYLAWNETMPRCEITGMYHGKIGVGQCLNSNDGCPSFTWVEVAKRIICASSSKQYSHCE